jgi:Phasin protein
MTETSRRPGENSERDQSDTRDRGRLHAVADQTAEVARQVGDKSAETVKRVAETAADATQRAAQVARETATQAADQSREAAMWALGGIPGVQGPLAQAGFEQSRRVVETTARVTDVYRQAAERASGDLRALFDSWTSLGRGLQQWQQAYVDAVRQPVESMARKGQDLVQTNSPVQFAEVQRDLYVDLVNHTFKASTTLLQLAGQITQEAVRPLQERPQSRA